MMVVEVEKPLGAFWLDWLYEKLSIFGLEESETAIQEFFDYVKNALHLDFHRIY